MRENKKKNNDSADDLSGKDRVVRNVITSWASHFILIIIGFIMPRMINDHLGQVSLGIWDLSWSFVNYLSMTGLGVGSSVNRYVAKYRSLHDYISLNRSLSSVVFIQFIMSLTIVVLTGLLVWLLPTLLDEHAGVEIHQVSWVVGLLGLSLAVQMAFDTSRGLLTGMHRWDIYNALNATSRIVSAILMIVAMILGGDLIVLAAIYFFITFLTESARSIISTRLCSELDLRREYVNLPDIKKMFRFGAKSIISGTPSLIISQTINIITASVMGPSALAVFARPVALIKHVETFLNKFSFVLTPMVGSISTNEKPNELKEFLLESVKYSVAFTLPILIYMSVLGDHLLYIWMGEDYAELGLILILSIGYFLPISQGPCLRVLMGMNQHGRVALINLGLTLVLLPSGLFFLEYIGWSLIYLAVLASAILTITLGIITPVYTCRIIGINYGEYLSRSFAKPVICGIVLLGWLLFCRQVFGLTPVSVLLVALAGQFFIVGILYWYLVIPAGTKAAILRRYGREP